MVSNKAVASVCSFVTEGDAWKSAPDRKQKNLSPILLYAVSTLDINSLE